MNRQESKRPGQPETRVLKIDLPVEDAVRRMFDYGLARKKRKGTVSKGGEEVQGRHLDEARMAGTHRRGPR